MGGKKLTKQTNQKEKAKKKKKNKNCELDKEVAFPDKKGSKNCLEKKEGKHQKNKKI